MKIIGYEEINIQLLNSLKHNKLHHANLIFGKKGIGKSSFIREFCLENLRSSSNFSSNGDFHPDLKIITFLDEKKEIGINQIREISEFLNNTSAYGSERFIIIDSACQLTNEASNSLLKNLEEPHKNNYFFLIAHNLSSVIPTLRSRCNLIKIPDLLESQFNEIILQNNHNFSLDELRFLKSITNNSPANAIDNGENLIKYYQFFLQSILTQKINDEFLKKIVDKTFPFMVIEKIISNFLCRFIKNYQKLNQDFFFEELEVFNLLSLRFSYPQASEIFDAITDKLNFIAHGNLDRKIFMINILNQLCYEKI